MRNSVSNERDAKDRRQQDNSAYQVLLSVVARLPKIKRGNEDIAVEAQKNQPSPFLDVHDRGFLYRLSILAWIGGAFYP